MNSRDFKNAAIAAVAIAALVVGFLTFGRTTQPDSQMTAIEAINERPSIEVSKTGGVTLSVTAEKLSQSHEVQNMEVQLPLNPGVSFFLRGLPLEGQSDAYLVVRGSPGKKMKLEFYLHDGGKVIEIKIHRFKLDDTGQKGIQVRYKSSGGKKRMIIN